MRKLVTAFTLLAGALAAASVAQGAATTVTGTVNAGTPLAATTPGTATFALTLDGTDQTPTYTVPVTVTDPRGSGLGWNLTITSTIFNDGSGRTFATGASLITNVTSGCFAGSTCTLPTNNVANPLTVPAAATAPAAVKFFNATANTGMGKITVTPTVTVSVPANVFAGSYSSTLTIAVATGP